MLQLPAKIHPIVDAVIRERETLFSLVRGTGSAVNIIFPQIMEENIAALQQLYRKHSLNGGVYYALKVNQSRAFLRQAKQSGIGLDAASEQELVSALAAGFTGKEIEVTGPKNTNFIRLALQHSCLLNVDSIEELETIIGIATETKQIIPVSILMRLSNFSPVGTGHISRFGISISQFQKQLPVLQKYHKQLFLKGFSFHIDTNAIPEKILAIDQLLDLYEHTVAAGLTPNALNIGGGFPQVFTDNPAAWNEYVSALKDSVVQRHEPLTWSNENYGYLIQNQMALGTPTFYKYGGTKTVEHAFTELMTAELPKHDRQTVAGILRENTIDLLIEPGKSSVDQAGITVAPVDFVKTSVRGDVLVGLAIKRDDVTPEDQEIMIDPVLIPRNTRKRIPETGIFFTGTLCMERNMITTHKTFVKEIPQPGDLVAFINTAAYNMDLSASNALMHPKLPKYAVIKDKNSIRWFLDDAYRPGATQV